MRAKKKTYIEILRIIAAFLVIVNHTNSTVFLNSTISKTWYASLLYFFISKIAVPIFIMIMGALLLEKRDTPKKYLIRIVRCVCVILVFSAINYAYFHEKEEWCIKGILESFLQGATNAYWYLYLYLGILIMLPILQILANALKKKELQLLLIISLLLAGTIPMLPLFSELKINSYLTTGLFNPYFGMLFCGLYIEKYMVVTKKRAFLAGLCFIILLALQVLMTRQFYLEDSSWYLQMDNRTYITITLGAICVFVIIKYLCSVFEISAILEKIIVYIGGLTFGIYLFGDLIIDVLKPFRDWLTDQELHIMVVTIIIQVCVFIMCGICTAILKLIPGIKKIL